MPHTHKIGFGDSGLKAKRFLWHLLRSMVSPLYNLRSRSLLSVAARPQGLDPCLERTDRTLPSHHRTVSALHTAGGAPVQHDESLWDGSGDSLVILCVLAFDVLSSVFRQHIWVVTSYLPRKTFELRKKSSFLRTR